MGVSTVLHDLCPYVAGFWVADHVDSSASDLPWHLTMSEIRVAQCLERHAMTLLEIRVATDRSMDEVVSAVQSLLTARYISLDRTINKYVDCGRLRACERSHVYPYPR